MARYIAWIYTFHCAFTAIWCLTLDPYPTVNVIRYNSQTVNCHVDLNWNSVLYYYGPKGATNIAFFNGATSNCKDIIDQTSGLYTTDCDDSIRTFYLTIKNVTDVYNGKLIKCEVFYSNGTKADINSVINVQYQPTTSPTITQTPVGPIIEGNKVTLTCTIEGGNPVATITWSCDGATQITPTGSPSTVDAISSVELVTSINNSGHICTCTGGHIAWTSEKTQTHTITVHYEPTSTPSILQTPPGPINEKSTVILTCDINGGNPLATITWTCEGSSPITPTGSPPTNIATSSVQLTVNSNDNGGICICIGHHPVWTPDKTTNHTLAVRYQPTTSPTVTQTPVGPIIEGNKVILTCTIEGGNPVATITWSCDGATQITPTGSPSTVNAISSVELVTSKNNSGQICTCTGRHILWTSEKTQPHNITVHYEPTSTPSILQTPPGPINEKSTVILTCDIKGGNPLATITWTCEGTSPINPTGSPPTNTATSSVQLTVNSNDNGGICICIGHHPVWTPDKTTNHTLDVRYQPTTSPTVTQTPVGPIIEGNKVILTCTIEGGNPVATITWSCDGATQITPTGSPSTVNAISSVELVTSKNNSGQICTCTGRHILWTSEKTQPHNITVHYEPTSTPSILQTPPGPINEKSAVILTCDIKEGNPLATITWTCEGSSPINPIGSPPTNTATSSVQLTVNSNDNGGICICIGHHPVWTPDKTTNHTLDVRYQPTTSPTLTQTPVGPIIEGNKVTLTCTIEGGNPVATITWSCDGATQITPTGSSSTVDAISSVELITSKNKSGQICTCTGRHILWTNNKTQQHNITVYYSPTVSIMNMDPFGVVENITLKLVCQVLEANPTVNSFSWYKGSSTTPIGMQSNFNISKVNRTDSGEYRCEGSNGVGQNGTDTVYVNVLYNPEIKHLSIIDGSEISENNTAIIQCKVESNPLSNVEWTFENKTLNEISHGVLQSNYTIQRATCVDTGFYMCTAKNIINMKTYSDKKVVQLSVKCSPRRDITFGLPANQIGLSLGQHLKMQIHIIGYPSPVVEWQFRSTDNSTKPLSSNCYQTNMFKHTACFEKDNVTEDDFGQYSIFFHNGLGNNFSYLFNVDPQGPPEMSSNVNTSCKILSADILWRTGFHGGEKQQFYVLVLDVKTRITKMYNTYKISKEKNEDKAYKIALLPGLYSFRIFGNNSFGNATSGESTCQVNNEASESDSVIAVAAGTGSAAAALIIGVVVVIVVLRKRMVKAKGNENSDDKGRLNMTPIDGDEVVEGLQENDCYVHFRTNDTGAANYEVVERKDQSNANDVKQDSQETALYSIVDKNNSAKGKTTSGEKTEDRPDQNEDVYENFTNQGSSDNQRQTVNKNGLQYAELVFNPLPNGSKFIIHRLEDKTIYAEVDTMQKIYPLPESDDEDKGNET